MLLVIPEIKLKNGRCILQISGEPGSEEYYYDLSHDPSALCKLWRKENAKTIHITDINGIRAEFDIKYFESIDSVRNATDIPVQVHSYFDNIDHCRELLDSGIYRLALDRLPDCNELEIKKLIEEYSPSRVVFFITEDNGRVHFDKNMSVLDYAHYIRSIGGTRIIYKDLHTGIADDIEPMRRIAEHTGLRITAFNGADTPEKLWELDDYFLLGIDSVILGYPLYNNNFPCQKIWRLIESELKD